MATSSSFFSPLWWACLIGFGVTIDIEEARDAVLDTNGDSEIVQCMVGDVEDKSFMKKALRGVRSVICPADLVVNRNSGGIQAILNGKLKKLAERDEEVLHASGVLSMIIRTSSLQSTLGVVGDAITGGYPYAGGLH